MQFVSDLNLDAMVGLSVGFAVELIENGGAVLGYLCLSELIPLVVVAVRE